MKRSQWTTLAGGLALGVFGVACDLVDPQPMCGCEPTFYGAVVSGSIVDAAGAPVANTPFMVGAVRPGEVLNLPETPSVHLEKTDAEGKFVRQIMAGEGAKEIRVAVYPSGRGLVVVSAGNADFHLNTFGTDTVKVAVTLPP